MFGQPQMRPSMSTEAMVTPARQKKENAYTELREAVEALDRYTSTISGHSNHELKQLAERIRALISDPD